MFVLYMCFILLSLNFIQMSYLHLGGSRLGAFADAHEPNSSFAIKVSLYCCSSSTERIKASLGSTLMTFLRPCQL